MNLSSDEYIQRLRQQYQELATLAGSLAHEIKNPLSVIRMNIELLGEDFEEMNSPEGRKALNRVEILQRQCVRLETMLNDFLRFTRLDNLELKAGNINEQILLVLQLFETQAAKQKVEIQRYLESDIPSIKMESQTFQAALVNLVKNALEAMPDGGQLMARTRLTHKVLRST